MILNLTIQDSDAHHCCHAFVRAAEKALPDFTEQLIAHSDDCTNYKCKIDGTFEQVPVEMLLEQINRELLSVHFISAIPPEEIAVDVMNRIREIYEESPDAGGNLHLLNILEL